LLKISSKFLPLTKFHDEKDGRVAPGLEEAHEHSQKNRKRREAVLVLPYSPGYRIKNFIIITSKNFNIPEILGNFLSFLSEID